MKKLLLLNLLSLLVAFSLSSCRQQAAGPAAPAPQRLEVVATISPLADWARQIAGPYAKVSCLLPPGASPHTFEPTPQQAELVAKCDVFVMVGLHLEEWASRFSSSLVNSKASTIRLGDELVKRHPELAERTRQNPHVWLNLQYAGEMCQILAQALGEKDPAHAAYYQSQAQAYQAKLQALDQRLQQEFAPVKGASVIAFHKAFDYFYGPYGIQEAGVVELQPGVEPSAGHLSQLAQLAAKQHVRCIIAEPELSDQAAKVLAESTKARVIHLDPLGNPDESGSKGYLELMAQNATVLLEALKQDEH